MDAGSSESRLLPRGLVPRLEELLRSVPVVVLEGARASGKTAVGEIMLGRGLLRAKTDLSDATTFAAAKASPTSFVDGLPTPALIDEAQLVPELSLAVKRRVDRERRPGVFLLTGSSRLGRDQLGGSDPLAGRSVRLRLYPMTQGELAGNPVNLLSQLCTQNSLAFGNQSIAYERLSHGALLKRIQRGGLPLLAGALSPVEPLLRGQLAQEYVEGVLYHETGQRHDRAELQRMFRYLAASTARIANLTTIASELGVSRPTCAARLASLESSFLIHSLSGHRAVEHRTLTAHPKLHASDCGLAAWAARLSDSPSAAVFGAMVETLVVNELLAQMSWAHDVEAIRHWRDTKMRLEVDAVVVQTNGSLIPVEVKAGGDVRDDDLRGLREFMRQYPSASRGIVFYGGDLVLSLDEAIWAIPISALWLGLGA